MSIGRIIAALALLASVGCSVGKAFPEEFHTVAVTRSGSEGFCASAGMVLNGVVTVADGLFQGTRAVPGTPPQGEACIGSRSTCLVRQPFAPIQVNAAEFDEIRSRVAAIPEKGCEKSLFVDANCDPCLITVVEVDGVSLSDSCCGGEPNEGFDESFRSLTSYLDGLAARTL